MNFALFHRADTIYGAPEFVKQAQALEPEHLQELDSDSFADPVRRLYPLHTKAATWLSAAQYFENAFYEERPNLNAARGILKAAKLHGIAGEVQGLIEKIASDQSKYTGELPDVSYALVADVGGTKHRFWPLLDEQTVKAAAAGLYAERHKLPYAMRKQAAVRISEKARSMGVQPEPRQTEVWDYLVKAAGLVDETRVSSGRLADAFKLRGTYLIADRGLSAQMDQIAKGITDSFGFADVPTETIEKSATLLDRVDRDTGLFREYTRGLPLPEEQIFDVNVVMEKTASAGARSVRLQTGNTLDLAGNAGHIPAVLGQLMPGYHRAVVDAGGQLDLEKAAAVLPTMPRDDARILELGLEALTKSAGGAFVGAALPGQSPVPVMKPKRPPAINAQTEASNPLNAIAPI